MPLEERDKDGERRTGIGGNYERKIRRSLPERERGINSFLLRYLFIKINYLFTKKIYFKMRFQMLVIISNFTITNFFGIMVAPRAE